MRKERKKHVLLKIPFQALQGQEAGAFANGLTDPHAWEYLGDIIEYGGFKFEALGELTDVDVSCAAEFEPLVAHFDLEGKFRLLEGAAIEAAHYGGGADGAEARKSWLKAELKDFKHQFEV